MQNDSREPLRITGRDGIVGERGGDHSISLSRNMRQERFPAQSGVRRLLCRLQAIGYRCLWVVCVSSIRNPRHLIFAGAHRQRPLSLDSSPRSFGRLPNPRDIVSWSGGRLLIRSIKVVYRPGLPWDILSGHNNRREQGDRDQ